MAVYDITTNNDFVIFTNTNFSDEQYHFRKGCSKFLLLETGEGKNVIMIEDGIHRLVVDYQSINTPPVTDNASLLALLSSANYFTSCGGGGGGGGPVVLAGDVIGPSSSNTINSLQGLPLTLTTPAAGDVLTWNGTSWVSAPPSGVFPPGNTHETIRYAAVNTPVATNTLRNEGFTLIPGIPHLALRNWGQVDIFTGGVTDTVFGTSVVMHKTFVLDNNFGLESIWQPNSPPFFSRLNLAASTIVGLYLHPQDTSYSLSVAYSNIFGGFGNSLINSSYSSIFGGAKTRLTGSQRNALFLGIPQLNDFDFNNSINLLNLTSNSSVIGMVRGVSLDNSTRIKIKDVYSFNDNGFDYNILDSRDVSLYDATNETTSNRSFAFVNNCDFVNMKSLWTFPNTHTAYGMYFNFKDLINSTWISVENDFSAIRTFNTITTRFVGNTLIGSYDSSNNPMFAVTVVNCSNVILESCGAILTPNGTTNHTINNTQSCRIERSNFENLNPSVPLIVTLSPGYYFRCNGLFRNKNITSSMGNRGISSFFGNFNLGTTSTNNYTLTGVNCIINSTVGGVLHDNMTDSFIVNSTIGNISSNLMQSTCINSVNAVSDGARSLFIESENCTSKRLKNGFIYSRNFIIGQSNPVTNVLVINAETDSNILFENIDNIRQSNTVFVEELGLAVSNTLNNKRTAGKETVNVGAGGSVTINTTRAHADKLIFITPFNVGSGSASGAYISNVVNGASFTVTFPNAFNGSINWMIINTFNIDV